MEKRLKSYEVFVEDLRKWFSKDHPDGDWKRVDSKGKVVGDCARDDTDGDGKGDSNPDRKGKPINVSNFGKGKL